MPKETHLTVITTCRYINVEFRPGGAEAPRAGYLHILLNYQDQVESIWFRPDETPLDPDQILGLARVAQVADAIAHKIEIGAPAIVAIDTIKGMVTP
jgi:hypothetical protein